MEAGQICIAEVSRARRWVTQNFALGCPLGLPGVKTALSLQGAWVPSLVGELKIHKPTGVAKHQKEKRKGNL